MEASKCLSCFCHCNLILWNLWGRSLITSSLFQLRCSCTPLPCVCFSLGVSSLGLDIAQPASSLPLPSVATGTTCSVWEGSSVFTSDLKLRGTCLKRQKLEKPTISSHLLHPEKAFSAKNEESNFQQASVWAGRLPWRQTVSWKWERRCVCVLILTSTGCVGQPTKTRAGLSQKTEHSHLYQLGQFIRGRWKWEAFLSLHYGLSLLA